MSLSFSGVPSHTQPHSCSLIFPFHGPLRPGRNQWAGPTGSKLPTSIDPDSCQERLTSVSGGQVEGGVGCELTRRPSGALTAALAHQQSPQRCLFVFSRLALQSWGALRNVDPARLPFSPEATPGFCTALCMRPCVFLLHAAPATVGLHSRP